MIKSIRQDSEHKGFHFRYRLALRIAVRQCTWNLRRLRNPTAILFLLQLDFHGTSIPHLGDCAIHISTHISTRNRHLSMVVLPSIAPSRMRSAPRAASHCAMSHHVGCQPLPDFSRMWVVVAGWSHFSHRTLKSTDDRRRIHDWFGDCGAYRSLGAMSCYPICWCVRSQLRLAQVAICESTTSSSDASDRLPTP